MSGSTRLKFGLMAVGIALVVGQGCAAATYQDAKLVGKGKVEITPTLTRIGFSEDGESEAIGTGFGAMVTGGVSDRVDFGAGYVRFKPKGGDGGSNFVGFGPKISLVRDRAALLVPVSFAFGEDVEIGETFQISPTAIFSVPIGQRVTFNPGAKIVWSNCDECEMLVGAQAGLSVPFGDGRVVLRPEIGALFNPGESGFVWTFGVGVSLRPR